MVAERLWVVEVRGRCEVGGFANIFTNVVYQSIYIFSTTVPPSVPCVVFYSLIGLGLL